MAIPIRQKNISMGSMMIISELWLTRVGFTTFFLLESSNFRTWRTISRQWATSAFAPSTEASGFQSSPVTGWITPMATVPKGTKGHFCSRIGWWWANTHRYSILLYYCGLLGVAVMVVLLQGCWQFSICQSTRFRNFNRVFFLYSLVFSLSFPVFHFPALLVTSHLCTFQISQIAFWLHTGTIGSFAHGAGELSRRAVGLKSQSWWHCTKQYQAA